MRIVRIHFFSVAALLMLTGSVSAAFIVDPISATPNGYINIANAQQTIDGSGLSNSSLVTTGSPIPALWPTVTPNINGFTTNYATDDPSPTLTYTLSATTGYELSGGHFWQYNGDYEGTGDRSLISAQIWVSTNGTGYTFAGTLLPGYVESRPYGTPDPGVDFNLNATYSNIQFVQLRDLVALGDPNITYAFNEIRFTAVPEPSALILGGLGLVGLLVAARRRKA